MRMLLGMLFFEKFVFKSLTFRKLNCFSELSAIDWMSSISDLFFAPLNILVFFEKSTVKKTFLNKMSSFFSHVIVPEKIFFSIECLWFFRKIVLGKRLFSIEYPRFVDIIVLEKWLFLLDWMSSIFEDNPPFFGVFSRMDFCEI